MDELLTKIGEQPPEMLIVIGVVGVVAVLFIFNKLF